MITSPIASQEFVKNVKTINKDATVEILPVSVLVIVDLQIQLTSFHRTGRGYTTRFTRNPLPHPLSRPLASPTGSKLTLKSTPYPGKTDR